MQISVMYGREVLKYFDTIEEARAFYAKCAWCRDCYIRITKK
jgi:predicted 3-demethylubiquinone-9 3-methyltransferase (glyoxalase superfamily)